MVQQVKQATIKALIYADIFNFPLTDLELWQYAIGKNTSKEQLKYALSSLGKKVLCIGNYYMFVGREHLVTIRQQREKISQKKLQKARKISRILSFIPTIRLIGVSGSVAMLNADKKDDIDLFFITDAHSVWISRLFISVLLALLGIRRKAGAPHAADAICPNMFIDTFSLGFPKNKQNLYIAHEIAQMIPLFCINTTYDDFVRKNSWLFRFLPNWKKQQIFMQHQSFIRSFFSTALKVFEVPVREVQKLYMKKRQTRETVLPSIIAFHPFNQEEHVITQFAKGCLTYEV